MSDWAEDKAREWLVKSNLGPRKTSDVDSLAALLREVALSEWGENAALRAEQTKVAEKLQNYIAMWKEAVAEREGIVSLMQHRIDELEAKLARCVEAIKNTECEPPAAATTIQEQGFWSAGVATLRTKLLAAVKGGE